MNRSASASLAGNARVVIRLTEVERIRAYVRTDLNCAETPTGQQSLPATAAHEPEAPPVDMAPDIYAAVASRRARIDWSRVHVRGDRAEPVYLADRPRWTVRARQLFSFEQKEQA